MVRSGLWTAWEERKPEHGEACRITIWDVPVIGIYDCFRTNRMAFYIGNRYVLLDSSTTVEVLNVKPKEK